MNFHLFKPALLIAVLCLPACHPKKTASEEHEIVKTQAEQISQLLELSKKQSDQIAQLIGVLAAEKNAAGEPNESANPQAGQRVSTPTNQFSIEGSAFITRSGGGSSVVRDLRVMLLSNAQIRWSAYVKPGETYSAISPSNDLESRLRADLAQFSSNVNDLIGAYATTDAEGKYKFANVAPGDYYLFAQYSGTDSTICWFVPVSVQQGGVPLQVNLANSTAYAIAWRELR